VSFSNLGSLPATEGVYALHDHSECLSVYGTESIKESIAQTSLGGQDFFGEGLWRADPNRLVWTYAKANGGVTSRQGIMNALIIARLKGNTGHSSLPWKAAPQTALRPPASPARVPPASPATPRPFRPLPT
jgi:hypothetical protein